MEKHFGDLVDFAFTADMENELDQIAGGTRDRLAFLREFYFGDQRHPGLQTQVTQNLERIDAGDINSIPIGKDLAGVDIVVKPGRYGPYLKRGEDTVSVPESLPPDELTAEKALALLSAPKGDVPLGHDPGSGLPVYVKQGRYGPYVQLGDPSDEQKPRTQSLFRTMKPETVTLAQALELLRLPRTLGQSAEGEDIVAVNGKYGPYLTKGKDSRNLDKDDEARLLTITLDEGLALFAQPKQFRGRGAPRPPLASFGPDPLSGKEIVLKEGRFGLFVTDGETNASLRKGDDPRDLTPERAAELLAARREYLASPEGQAKAARGAGRKGQARAPRPKAAREAKAPAAAKPARKAARTPRKAPGDGAAKPASKTGARAPRKVKAGGQGS